MGRIVLVRGAGDVGSAVAHVLHAAGHRVAIHDGPAPAYGRRGMAFVDAIFDGSALLEGTLAKKARELPDLQAMLRCGKAVPVSTAEFSAALHAVLPDVLVDARMDKRAMPEAQRDLAPLTIGLGPNFTAGVTTHLAIETAWGPGLGAVLARGTTRRLEGEPRELGGHGRERFVYAPASGIFSTDKMIGDRVEQGQRVATLAERDICAPLSGLIRGLTRSGLAVKPGTKVVEIDPRRAGATVFGLGERPRRIAEGVLGAITQGMAAG